MGWLSHVRALWRWNRVQSELEEIQFHLSEEADERAAAGASGVAAAAAARKDFGSTALVLESAKDAWRWRWLAELGQDVHYAWRSMRRHPGFSAVAVLTLGVGIGAASAIVSVVDAILFEPLPYTDADRLVRIVERFPTISGDRERGIAYADFLEWRGHSTTLSDAAGISGMAQRTVKTDDGVAALWGAMTSGNTFDVLGTRALLGRTLQARDDTEPDVIVLGFDTWQRHFHGDARIVGRQIELRAGALQTTTAPRLLTVVGVLPADFSFERFDFFTPMVVRAGQGGPPVTMIGHIHDGVSLAAANEEANVLGAAIRPAATSADMPLEGHRFLVQLVKESAVAELRPALRLFVGAVFVVLVIVCANIAGLLLARGSSRRDEIATRLAIGASGSRILRQILGECLLLASIGGVLGVGFAAAGIWLLTSLATVDAPGIFKLMFGTTILPRAQEVHINVKLLGIVFGAGTLAAFVFGILPAVQLSRTNHALVGNVRGGSQGRAAVRTRSVLVAAQLALATSLLIGAGLLLRSLWSLATVDKGYDSHNVVAMNLLFPDQYSVATKADTIGRVLNRLRTLPQVQAAGFSRHGMLIGEEITGIFTPAGRTAEQIANTRLRMRPVSSGFLTAMGVPVLRGREFATDDDASTEPLMVMNASAARVCFGSADPLNQQVSWTLRSHATSLRVIGVVDDVRQVSLADKFVPEVFINYRQALTLFEHWGESAAYQNQTAIGFLSFAIRTRDRPDAAIAALRRSVRDVDENIGVDAVLPMSKLVDSSLTRQRFYAVVLGIFAGVAAFLAAIGVYGLLAYAVAERTREIAIRMALGAARSTVLGMVLKSGLALSVVGIAGGLVAAAAGAPLLRSLLFAVQPLDGTTFAIVSVLFMSVVFAACLVPARRATAVDPMASLKTE